MTSLPVPGPSTPSTPRPGLTRSGTEKMIGGVAGGLAQHTDLDPLLWRLAFVALTLAGGSGILLYALLWLLVPAEEDPVR
jgi:phage shock protein PspC (stress-responsive transcriptional regulator)